MPEPLTIAGAGLAVLGSKDLLNKLLGPTADYIGGEIAGFVEKCNINLDSVFLRAQRKLGKRIDEQGSVNPRVLRYIVDDGRFCEDEVVAEYYAGMLAGSREATGKDDQSLPYLSKIKQMSTYQVKMHFAIYSSLLVLHKTSELNLGMRKDWDKAGLFLPHSLLLNIFPHDRYWDIMTHSVVGLKTHDLIDTYAYGDAEIIKKYFPNVNEGGAYVAPNFVGAELFLWALGIETPNGHRFFDAETIELNNNIMAIPEGAQKKES